MLLKGLIRSELHSSLRVFMRGISTKSQWDIVTGVCVERLPVVTPPLNDIQKKYKELLWTIEIEKSLKSDHEIRHENDKIQEEILKSESHDLDLDAISKITAQDFEDAANEEIANFKFGSIETGCFLPLKNHIILEADKKGDKETLERCLQRHLVLVAPVKLGSDVKTLLPQGKWAEGETLRQTAERVLTEFCGSDLKVQFLSNAPCGFYKYKYPPSEQKDGKIGAKIFFYYANHKGGAVKSSVKTKFNWLTRNELTETLPLRYNKSVKEFLIEESY